MHTKFQDILVSGSRFINTFVTMGTFSKFAKVARVHFKFMKTVNSGCIRLLTPCNRHTDVSLTWRIVGGMPGGWPATVAGADPEELAV